MALSAKSLFLYGYTVTPSNQNIDFIAVSAGPTLTAVVPIGTYSLSTILTAIQVAMATADTTSGNIYTLTADRTIMGGTQNRVTINSTGAFFSLLFGTGPNASSSLAFLLGFNSTDRTGATNYTGNFSTGSVLIPDFIGYNYADQNQQALVFGAVNISASGLKEAVVFNEQYFIDVEFKYEPKSKLATQWVPFRDWVITQAPFDFTPEISSPTVFSPVTLEKSSYGKTGMGFLMKEMLPDFPNEYTTGPLNFRVVIDSNTTVYITG